MVDPSHHSTTLVISFERALRKWLPQIRHQLQGLLRQYQLTFKESASGLPTEEEIRHSGGDSAKSPGPPPTDPRSAAFASDIRSKFEKASQSTPPQQRGRENIGINTQFTLREWISVTHLTQMSEGEC